jgi:putative spermidine/putrescine transport system ATP-binding protein
VLEIVGLCKHYGTVRALDNVSFSIEQGSFTTILGPSGSGKSTLLLGIAGFVAPTFGDIRLDGQSILRLSAERRNFGVVFQGYALFPHLRVRENIAFPLRMRGMRSAEIERRVKHALALVQLERYAERHPRELSGGQQQRVALARALVFDPSLVLLDEPLSALDKGLREALRQELRKLHKTVGMTFILVTHDQDEALELSDHVAIVNHGRLEQFAEPATLYNAPASRFVAEFLGKSNFIAVRSASGGQGLLHLQAGGHRFEHRQADPPSAASVVLALRPERLKLLRNSVDSVDGAAGAANILPGVVSDVSYRGAEAGASVATDLGTLVVRVDTADSRGLPLLGEQVRVAWEATAGYLLPDDVGASVDTKPAAA